MTGKAEQYASAALHAPQAALAGVHCAQDEDTIRKQLDLILESQVFKGSRRSQEFLRFVVEKSLAGHFDDLKERILGVELFGRPITYDTSQDAVVRVTANDVRKRLAHYYEKLASGGEFRIDLPSGSYIAEFTRVAAPSDTSPSGSPDMEMGAFSAPAPAGRAQRNRRGWIHAPAYIIALLATAFAIGPSVEKHLPPTSAAVSPWSAIFRDGSQTQLIFCDASIPILQDFLKINISLSDYATRKFIPESLVLRPEAHRVAALLTGPDFRAMAAPADLRIASQISELAAARSHRLRLRSARELQFRDFKTDDDFILLGSPRSNPWTALFQDQLDFSFVMLSGQQHEVCRNAHPRPGERPVYVPTAVGGATGEAYAIAAFIQNPDQKGNVIILAGSNAEGTEAAAKFMTNVDLVAKTLRTDGIDPTGAPIHFEALLSLSTMAGSPNHFQVIALHWLS
jgi:S-layer like family, C-terminal region